MCLLLFTYVVFRRLRPAARAITCPPPPFPSPAQCLRDQRAMGGGRHPLPPTLRLSSAHIIAPPLSFLDRLIGSSAAGRRRRRKGKSQEGRGVRRSFPSLTRVHYKLQFVSSSFRRLRDPAAKTRRRGKRDWPRHVFIADLFREEVLYTAHAVVYSSEAPLQRREGKSNGFVDVRPGYKVGSRMEGGLQCAVRSSRC